MARERATTLEVRVSGPPGFDVAGEVERLLNEAEETAFGSDVLSVEVSSQETVDRDDAVTRTGDRVVGLFRRLARGIGGD